MNIFQKAGLTIKNTTVKTIEWIKLHPYETIIIGAAALGTGLSIADEYAKIKKINTERRHTDRLIYDRSLGAYYETKRSLSNYEKMEIDMRRKSGEPLGLILDDMGLLK